MADQDKKYMQMALKLAEHGIGQVEPNPAVGCIIVKASQVIGKGWHNEFGGPHAEINAIEDCKTLGAHPLHATMYVTLEPCCTQGKTGPCTEAIIRSGVSEIVIATIDPSPQVNGKSIELLKEAGIKVKTGVCEREAKLMNAPFIKFVLTGKCWVTLKWAQSIDGKTAWVDGQKWVSNESSRKNAHQLRQNVQAILVGINTVLADSPLLTSRTGKGKQPLRVVLDSHLKIPHDCILLNSLEKAPLLIVTTQETMAAEPQKIEQLTKKGAEILAVPTANGMCDIKTTIDQLSKRGITRLLVEGGPKVIASFLKERLADDINIYIATKMLGSLGIAGISDAMQGLSETCNLYDTAIETFDGDVCIKGLTKEALKTISIDEKAIQ